MHSAARFATLGPSIGTATYQGSRASVLGAAIASSARRRSAMVRASGPDTAMICEPIERSGPEALKFGARPSVQPQAVDAAGVGRIAHRAGDVRAVADMADTCGGRRARAAGRAARRDRVVVRVFGQAVQLVVGEPAIGEGRRIGAADDGRAAFQEVVDQRAVRLRDKVALQAQSVGGGETCLVGQNLDRNRHACERAHVVAARHGRVHRIGLRERIVRTVIDHGVDERIDPLQPRKRRCHRFACGNLPRPHQRGNLGGRQTPDVIHGLIDL